MGKFKDLLEEAGLTMPQAIAKAFQDKLNQFGFSDIEVDEVDIYDEGGIAVTFTDEDDNEMTLFFDYTDEDGVTATVLGDEEDDEEYTLIDLDPLDPPTVVVGFRGMKYPKLDDLFWLNKSSMAALLMAGDIGNPDNPNMDGKITQNDVERNNMPKRFGFFQTIESIDGSVLLNKDEEFEVVERMVTVVRGGHKVRIPVVRKVRRHKLSPAQKASIRKAVRKRKMKASQIQRKRKKSLKLRKRSGLKNNKFNKFQKAAGTANRKP